MGRKDEYDRNTKNAVSTMNLAHFFIVRSASKSRQRTNEKPSETKLDKAHCNRIHRIKIIQNNHQSSSISPCLHKYEDAHGINDK